MTGKHRAVEAGTNWAIVGTDGEVHYHGAMIYSEAFLELRNGDYPAGSTVKYLRKS